MESEDNKFKILHFSYTKENKENEENSQYKIKNYKFEYKYLLSKSDYEKRNKSGKRYNKNYYNNNENKFNYIYNFKDLSEKDFVLVDEEYLKELKCNDFSRDNAVFYFKSGNKHFILFYDDEVIEINDKKEENKKNEIKTEKKENDEINENEEENIMKSLILLYANEKEIQKLLNSYIVDEYDLKEYYLINKNFIDEFMYNNNYTKVRDILDKENYNYSYNGYYFNLNKIMEKSKLKKIKLKKKLYKEKNFYPEFLKKNWIKKDESIKPLDKFILVPKNLFDLLYKTIENIEYSKDEFKYKILIGDGIVFLQNRDNNSQFSIYRFVNEKFKIFYYLEFDEQLSFYEDVNNYIKGKGLLNYVIQKNLDTNNKSEVSYLKDIEDNTIGNYINIRKIEKDKINVFKSKERIDKLKNIFFCYNNFLNELVKLQENDISISKIKDICELIKKNKISFLKTKIISDNDLINLKNLNNIII